MQERHVTVAGERHDMPAPFHVLATQNPIEQEGTYPLPEAQLDRFLLQIDVPYPDQEAERQMLVATTVAIGLWFMKSNLAFAMALSISIARAGSYAADMSPTFAKSLYDQGWQQPLLLAAGLAAVSFLMAVGYWYLERKTPPPVAAEEQKSDRIAWRDILSFNRSYWYILALCVLFYSVIFPFRSTFAIKYFQHAHELPLDQSRNGSIA